MFEAPMVLRLTSGIITLSKMSKLAIMKIVRHLSIIHPLSYSGTGPLRREESLEAPDKISKQLVVLISWHNALLDPARKLA